MEPFYPLRCKFCNRKFSTRSNVKKHERIVHKLNTGGLQYDWDTALFKCLEGCEISFKLNTLLRIHLGEKHGLPMQVVERKFETYEDFRMWLKAEEQKKGIKYEKKSGPKKTNAGVERVYFDCMRTGKQPKPIENPIRKHAKVRGSHKLNAACTSQIIVYKNLNSGECSIKYFSTHYGHVRDIVTIGLLEEDRKNEAVEVVGSSDDDITEQIVIEFAKDDISKIHCIHQAAARLQFNVIQTDPNNFLLLENYTEEKFRVCKNTGIIGPCCELSCEFCKICVHNFNCSCADFTMNNTIICQHIHYVCLNYKKVTMTEVDSNSAKDELVAGIKSSCSQIIENIETRPQTEENLRNILKSLEFVVSITANKSEVALEPVRKKIKEEPSV